MLARKIPMNELEKQVLQWVEEQITLPLSGRVKVGVSNRHVHLDHKDLETLFGRGHQITPAKYLGQPGQFAAEETVILRGPKGEMKSVRVLGPIRPETQIEISVTDGYALGIKPPVRESGDISDTPGIEIIGPAGSVKKDRGVIAAKRHIHMLPKDAERLGLEDKQIMDVCFNGPRGAVLKNVLLRVTDTSALEMHIDVDEANALGIRNGDTAEMILSSEK